jgi:hypothetical protein
MPNQASIGALQKQFERFVEDFNNHNWSDIRDTLDVNVLIVGVDRPEIHTIRGIDGVIKFLKDSHGHFDRPSPVFRLFEDPEGPIKYQGRVIEDHGGVIGVGYWTDTDDNNLPMLISFIFVDRGKPDAPDWKAIRLWGSRPLGDLK